MKLASETPTVTVLPSDFLYFATLSNFDKKSFIRFLFSRDYDPSNSYVIKSKLWVSTNSVSEND